MDMGGAILGHVFGGQQGNVAAALGKSTSLLPESGQEYLQLLAMLAPIVMGVLGKQHKERGGLLGSLLGGPKKG